MGLSRVESIDLFDDNAIDFVIKTFTSFSGGAAPTQL
jgi:hypothetical protein